METITPIHLHLAHTPFQSERDIVHLTQTQLNKKLQDVETRILPSGEDVLAILAHTTRKDLLLIETEAKPTPSPMYSHPLDGTTVMVEAADLKRYTLPYLRDMTGSGQLSVLRELRRISNKKYGGYLSERLIRQALEGTAVYNSTEPVLEAAALLRPLLGMAETAVSQNHSLIIQYTVPSNSASPHRASNGFPFPRKNYYQAQGRPLIASVLYGIAFTLIALAVTPINDDNWVDVIVRSVFNLIFMPLAFLMPVLWAQMGLQRQLRRRGFDLEFVAGADVTEKGKAMVGVLRPFYLIPLPDKFVLTAVYLPTWDANDKLPNPAKSYFLYFGLAILIFVLNMINQTIFPQEVTPFLVATMVSSLFFAIVHLLVGD